MNKNTSKVNVLYLVVIIVLALPSIIAGFFLDLPFASIVILLITIFIAYNFLKKDKNS